MKQASPALDFPSSSLTPCRLTLLALLAAFSFASSPSAWSQGSAGPQKPRAAEPSAKSAKAGKSNRDAKDNNKSAGSARDGKEARLTKSTATGKSPRERAEGTPAAPVTAGRTPSAESMLNAVFDEIGQRRFDAALQRIDKLIAAHPNFRLAHLIKGDLLLARTRPISEMGAAPKAPADRLQDLRAEAIARLRAYRDKPEAGLLPRYVMQMTQEQQFALVVDTTRARLYVYSNDNGRPRFVTDYYVSSGKQGALKTREGDLKTPIGVYHVTSSLSQKKLPDFYGSGAFPINYPNIWDRRLGRNGHGIWLHGTPSDTFSRPPRASDGCVVLANTDLDALAKHVQIGLTPVIISDQVEWVSEASWTAERQAFMKQFEQWRTDWESLDTDRFLQNYSRKFSSGEQDFDGFARNKRQVNAGKQWIKVGASRISMFRSPGKEDLVTVTFDQDYRSSNLSNVMKKRQYWVREGNRWRIVYEGPA
jgi:murein L,D-transpeptidase YafK